MEGKAIATKRDLAGNEDIVYEYDGSGYFGELSLLKGGPRAASVIAKVDLG